MTSRFNGTVAAEGHYPTPDGVMMLAIDMDTGHLVHARCPKPLGRNDDWYGGAGRRVLVEHGRVTEVGLPVG